MYTPSRPVCLSRRSSLRPFLMFALTALMGLPFALSLTGCDSSSRVSGTGTSGGTNTGGTPAAGKATMNLTFSNAAGTNVNTSAITSANGQAGLSVGAANLNNLSITASTQAGGPLRMILLSLITNGAAQAGTTYPVGGGSSSQATNVSLTQTTISTTSAGTPSAWGSDGHGNIIVDSVSGKTYKLRLVDVTMSTGEGNDSAATGTYTLNGTITATVQ